MQTSELINIEIENTRLNQIINELQNILISDLPSGKKALLIEMLKRSPAILIGGYSGFPYLRAGTGLAGNNLLLRILLSYGTIAGIAYLSSYVLINLADDLEYELTSKGSKNKSTFFKKISTFALAMACGVVTAAPSAYVGYTYNNNSFSWMLSALITDSILYSYSVKQLIFRYNYKKFLYSTQKNYKYFLLSKIQVEMIEMLIFSSKQFPSLQGLMDTQQADNNVNIIILLFLEHSSRSNKFNKEQRTNDDKFISVSKVLSLIFAITWEIINFVLSYYGFRLITNNLWIAIPLALIPICLSTILQYDLGSQTFISIQKNIRDACNNGTTKSYSHFHYPKIFVGLCIVGIITAILSLGTRAKITTDVIYGLFGILLAIPVSISTAAYKITAIFKINENLIQYCDRWLASSNFQIHNNYYKISRLVNHIKLLSIDDFELLLNHIGINSICDKLENDVYLHNLLKSYQDLDIRENSNSPNQTDNRNNTDCVGLNKLIFWNKSYTRVSSKEAVEDNADNLPLELKPLSHSI